MTTKREKNRQELKKVQCVVLLREIAELSIDQLYTNLHSSYQGLTTAYAKECLENYGYNLIRAGKKKGRGYRLIKAFINPFNLVLMIITIITFTTDVLLAVNKDYVTSIIILILIVSSSAIAFFQGERSNSAASKLSRMISNQADVFRDGKLVSLPIQQLVPGDVIQLSAGDMIPGDVRFLTAKDAFLAQSALTGESNPVEKFSEAQIQEKMSLTDIPTLGFMGSNMVSGSARALVLTTGNSTYFGSMAKSLSGDKAKNSFEKGVDAVSKLLIQFMSVMVPIIFLINGLTKQDWLSSFLFAITLAVGLTPVMLPMIMSSTLAKGAVAMAKQKTIVKTLSSIQTFGEMNILCTDKTGTLTEDKIILEKYMDLSGQDDQEVLKTAYLNSYFQTGLKNVIDLAVIQRGVTNHVDHYNEEYFRVDEIPFDFSRRRMSVILKCPDNTRWLVTKGAVDEMMRVCTHALWQGHVVMLDESIRQKARQLYEQHNRNGLRMIAVAQRQTPETQDVFSIEDESDLILTGFIGFLDPPKESAKLAIEALQENGVRVVVLTGDSEGVAIKVCNKVGVNTSFCLSGQEVEEMSQSQLRQAVLQCSLFSKLSPVQKQRIVATLQQEGNTVGYMGDGINDALAMHQADVGISVDSAVDIAKETADIILLEKDLMVLEQGVLEGRRTFGNIMKYIKMAASGNFGNMISIMIASIFLPFLPLLPVHILAQNLLCDFSQMGIPFDQADASYLKVTHRWDTKSILRFMLVMGPLSSLFDIAVYAVLWWVVQANTMSLSPLFQCGCFVFGTLSQVMIVHMIRTEKIPFIQSRASIALCISTGTVSIIALFIGFTKIAMSLDLSVLPLSFLPWLLAICFCYCVSAQFVKKGIIAYWKEWM